MSRTDFSSLFREASRKTQKTESVSSATSSQLREKPKNRYNNFPYLGSALNLQFPRMKILGLLTGSPFPTCENEDHVSCLPSVSRSWAFSIEEECPTTECLLLYYKGDRCFFGTNRSRLYETDFATILKLASYDCSNENSGGGVKKTKKNLLKSW